MKVPLEFVMRVTEHDEETIKQMYRDWDRSETARLSEKIVEIGAIIYKCQTEAAKNTAQTHPDSGKDNISIT